MPLLEVRNVAKRYGPVVALKSAELVVEPGEVHALLGANGAGKSTLVKILTGVIRHDAGTIQLNGKDIRIGSPEGARRAGLAPVYQDPALLPDLTVAQNMRLTRTPIAGVREALVMMPTGARWEVFLPAEKAFGNDPRSPVGPGQALVFDIKLVSVK